MPSDSETAEWKPVEFITRVLDEGDPDWIVMEPLMPDRTKPHRWYSRLWNRVRSKRHD